MHSGHECGGQRKPFSFESSSAYAVLLRKCLLGQLVERLAREVNPLQEGVFQNFLSCPCVSSLALCVASRSWRSLRHAEVF
eukprot:6330790-Amphidinium_carterae.1